MREIKFRGIRTAKGKMTYGDLHYHDIFGLPFINGNEVYSATVGQYTGLKDNTKWEELSSQEQEEWINKGNSPKEWQGKEIYEGDVLRIHNAPMGMPEIKDTLLKIEPLIYYIQGMETYLPAMPRNWDKCSVIGNIHENPELLENIEQLEGANR